MTLTLQTTLTITHRILSRMALFMWGFIWLFMSILIFFAGRILPQLRPKPPPPSPALPPRSLRIRSAQVSPKSSPPKSIVSQPVETASSESVVSAPARAPVLGGRSANKKPAPRKKWSLPTRLFPGTGRSAPSPKSSLLSDGSATLVGSPPSPRFFPELPLVESVSPSSDPGYSYSRAGSAHSTPSSTPRMGRGIHLPGAKAFKSLSRKISVKKSDTSRNRSHSPRASGDMLPPEEDSFYNEQSSDDKNHRDGAAEASRAARPGHLVHTRGKSLPGEVFTTSFVNPFRSRARKSKSPPAVDLSDPTPSPLKRPSTPRRVFASFQLALTSTTSPTRSHSYTQSKSRRSSVSSTSTAVSAVSAPSALSLSGVDSSPRIVSRTQPYAAPYFAPMPGPSRPTTKSDPRPKPRRATSLSPPRRPETVAEESAEEHLEDSHPARGPETGAGALDPLELTLGQLGHGRPRWQRKESRQRVAVSEGAIRLAER